MEKKLYHAGIKGMKWGVRRYQNPDGTLTPEGEKRYAKNQQKSAKKAAAVLGNEIKNFAKGKDPNAESQTLAKAKVVVDATSNAVKTAKDINKEFGSARKNPRMDLSKMSDQEMRTKINRELLERQYNDVFNPPRVSRGQQIVGKTLEVAGGVLAAGASALGIALAIKQLRA